MLFRDREDLERISGSRPRRIGYVSLTKLHDLQTDTLVSAEDTGNIAESQDHVSTFSCVPSPYPCIGMRKERRTRSMSPGSIQILLKSLYKESLSHVMSHLPELPRRPHSLFSRTWISIAERAVNGSFIIVNYLLANTGVTAFVQYE